ncbi:MULTISPECIES: glycoside hydrolase family 5 protein [Vibrio]|uniref:glycoside hydrolase family 5 protein n=2 Tax=Vibrionaceae TaxID=641 RepID=UPI00034B7BF0|nr:glycoside hydrolase family 5 protein [Vibrio parahaemolyticus]BDP34953.1 endoglucanase [Vibrio alginolyticus]EGQ8101285.1 glycoside hydrolase family 5 protein [Vibrio parahaemolyticus]EGQ9289671.1 glycoside hydrolase family 5 protein [Vibrio parahaemolyticus]EGU0168328.1 glycoside hydrolase family 5 protein [Vibrio parahaemolyticus]EJB8540541.1 cellulase family glycosylhydrolase [Vibrio parahaemolyticus]
MFREIKVTSVAMLSLITLMGCGSGSSDKGEQSVVLDSRYYTDMYHWNDSKGLNVTALGRGINMGNYLESPTYEGEWNNNLTIQASDFRNISQTGFSSVRIPVRWSAHSLINDPNTIDDAFLSRVQEVVDQAIQEDLKVIINTHHFDELFYDDKDFDYQRSRLLKFWNQLSKRFPISQYNQDQLIFEFLNEPHENVTVKEWNSLISDLTDIVWNANAVTQNNALGQRKVMIGPADWGGVSKLPYLELPKSSNPDNTIITVHFYEPFQFTHQGASWVDGADAWIGTRWLATESQQKVLLDYLNIVDTWNAEPGHGFEINIGEFGVYSQYSAREDQRAWTAFITREAEKKGYSWNYWEYSSGFGAYDPYTEQWRKALVEGLIPKNADSD